MYEPDVLAQASRILHMQELGDMQPTQLMDNMLALLPNGEQPGILFKSVFLAGFPEICETMCRNVQQSWSVATWPPWRTTSGEPGLPGSPVPWLP